MFEVDTGGGFVDVLAAGALGTDEGFLQVLLAESASLHAVLQGLGFLLGYGEFQHGFFIVVRTRGWKRPGAGEFRR